MDPDEDDSVAYFYDCFDLFHLCRSSVSIVANESVRRRQDILKGQSLVFRDIHTPQR